MSDFDWKKFDGSPEDTAICQCGEFYRTHTRLDMKQLKIVARKSCPKCGRVFMRKTSSDKESFTL